VRICQEDASGTTAVFLYTGQNSAYNASPKYPQLLLLGGELLAERCRTDDLMPTSLSLSLAFLHAVWTPKFRGCIHPHLLFSARWLVGDQRAFSSLLVVLEQQR